MKNYLDFHTLKSFHFGIIVPFIYIGITEYQFHVVTFLSLKLLQHLVNIVSIFSINHYKNVKNLFTKYSVKMQFLTNQYVNLWMYVLNKYVTIFIFSFYL